MNDLEIGQVISLRIRFNNSGQISSIRHPYLVVGINRELGIIEIAQLDSLEGKEYKAAMRCNKVIYCDDPQEKVIDKDSYLQLDNTFLIEIYDGLIKYRRQPDKLSKEKLKNVLEAYYSYHKKYQIDENKQVYMTQQEVESLQ